MRQLLRIYACIVALCIGGFAGALIVDGTLGERQRVRDRAAHPDQVQCSGAGIDIYVVGGFVLGAVPMGWLLGRLGAIGWVKSGMRNPPSAPESTLAQDPSTDRMRACGERNED